MKCQQDLAPLHSDFEWLIFSGLVTVIDVSERLQSLPRGYAGEGWSLSSALDGN